MYGIDRRERTCSEKKEKKYPRVSLHHQNTDPQYWTNLDHESTFWGGMGFSPNNNQQALTVTSSTNEWEEKNVVFIKGVKGMNEHVNTMFKRIEKDRNTAVLI